MSTSVQPFRRTYAVTQIAEGQANLLLFCASSKPLSVARRMVAARRTAPEAEREVA